MGERGGPGHEPLADGDGSSALPRTGLAPRVRSRAARSAWAALALLAAVVAFGVWLRVAGADPLPVDRWWHDAAGVDPGSPAFALASALAVVGSGRGAALCAVAAAGALLATRRWRDAVALLTAMLIGVILSETAKALVARPRPLDALLDPPGFSYPSGHSMGAAALAVSLALAASAARPGLRRAVWAAAVLWILLMMWSRTAVQVHWLSDTVAGAALGVSAALAARALWSLLPTRALPPAGAVA